MKKPTTTARKTIGFGVPDEIDPHHFTVEIPTARTEPVIITERFGLKSGSSGLPDAVERCRLSRAAWTAIAEEAKRVLNERLKEKELATSRWSSGRNSVERLLGRELCVLAWGIEVSNKDLIPNAIRIWASLKPEERWWLFSMSASLTGLAEDTDIGWRKAIRVALTETPGGDEIAVTRAKRRPLNDIDRPQLPLFK
ncbi:DUF3780 domain-containing protein [Methylobacterium sp. E-016]|uniref:anti-phage-associated DUF3780 domain-containing protein n=1 Tax=Methylobacterium sp. E-016 TaxID=2836556 RepID=UPI001FB91942|nr:anti-phage-associated DUF3780 domain-containing protein [Methylobacterium sp. E-016]MCJ2077673.1 DUF3780 domain-containing protein [Methylobacterium sp. E-016]